MSVKVSRSPDLKEGVSAHLSKLSSPKTLTYCDKREPGENSDWAQAILVMDSHPGEEGTTSAWGGGTTPEKVFLTFHTQEQDGKISSSRPRILRLLTFSSSSSFTSFFSSGKKRHSNSPGLREQDSPPSSAGRTGGIATGACSARFSTCNTRQPRDGQC